MQSEAKNVNSYLAEIPEERQEMLTQLRALCLDVLKGYQESMVYGMPSYQKGQKEAEVAFASQKNYISLYILKQDVLDRYRDRLKKPGVSMGKGCVRFSKPEKIDLAIIREMLQDSSGSNGAIC